MRLAINFPRPMNGCVEGAQRVGVVFRKWEGALLFHHERLGPPFQCRVGVVHDFITRQGGKVGEESGVDKQRE